MSRTKIQSVRKRYVTILIPVHNEAKIIQKTVEILLRWKYKQFLLDILIIENGSTDQTPIIAKKLVQKHKQVSLLKIKNAGYGIALKQGMFHSKSLILAIFNADYYDFNFLKQALDLIDSYDLIIGSKTLTGSRDQRSVFRKIVTRNLTLILKLFFGFKGTDTHGMKVLRRLPLLPIIKQCQNFHWLFDTEMVIRAERNGLRIKELPTSTKEQRDSVNSLYSRILRFVNEFPRLVWAIYTK